MATRKQRWFAAFEASLTEDYPVTSGRINWDIAAHLRFQGLTPQDASGQYACVKSTEINRLTLDAANRTEQGL